MENPYQAPESGTEARREAVEAAPTVARGVVLAGLCAAAAIAYLQRNAIATAAIPISADLNLDKNSTGLVMGSFFLTYALFQIPSGWLGDRWGARRALTLYSTAWSLFTLLMAFGNSATTLIIARAGAGAAQAGIFPMATSSIARWLPRARRSFATGLLSSFMSVGGVMATALVGWMLTWLNWRWTIGVLSIPGLLWAAWFYFWYRDTPEEHRGVNGAELAIIREGQERTPNVDSTATSSTTAHATPWLAIASSVSMWALCGQQFFRAAGYMFYTSWFPTYLKEARGVSLVTSGLLTSLPLLAVVVGSPLGGALADWLLARTGNRRIAWQAVGFGSMLACAGLILVAYYTQNTLLAVGIITLGSFCSAVGAPVAYTIPMEMGGRHVATVFSTMNMSGNLGAFAFPSVVAFIVERTGNWDLMLFVFSGIYLVAAAFWLLLNPNSRLGTDG